jgi:hypothetical protein
MSLAQIEAELDNLSIEELRQLALKSMATLEAKTCGGPNQICDEDDPRLLAALDEAVRIADTGGKTYSADEVRAQLRKWTSK